MKGFNDIGDQKFVIVGSWRRELVALDDDRARVRLRWSVGMIYGAVCVICGCAEEAKSRAQRRTSKNSDVSRGSYLGSREAGKNERSDIPQQEVARGRSGHYEGREALLVRDRKGRHNLLMILNIFG